MPTPVLLALGANLGDPLAQLARAVQALGEWIAIRRVSSVYRTEPVGWADQPDFLNLVLTGDTELAPARLLEVARETECALGRVRSFPNAPRTVDIDLLAYGEQVRDTPALTLPHPRLAERAFVLVPLAEVAPEWRHPVLGLAAGELLAGLGERERVERIGALLGWPPVDTPQRPL